MGTAIRQRTIVPQLNPLLPVPVDVQARVLRTLFLNQGAYNLLLALGGLHGLRQLRGPHPERGEALLTFLLLFAVGAALTLLATTEAYILGALQLVPPAAALAAIRRSRVGALAG